ncbi:hypothetical protein KCP71_24115 [Salmonella enterica subsp. enterica]|nr:hypothetical protein KCP71_24115 [Salmonella enterica subsp. enterica]
MFSASAQYDGGTALSISPPPSSCLPQGKADVLGWAAGLSSRDVPALRRYAFSAAGLRFVHPAPLR